MKRTTAAKLYININDLRGMAGPNTRHRPGGYNLRPRKGKFPPRAGPEAREDHTSSLVKLIIDRTVEMQKMVPRLLQNLNIMQIEMSKFAFESTEDMDVIDAVRRVVKVNPTHITCAPILNDENIYNAAFQNVKDRFDLADNVAQTYESIKTFCSKGRDHCFITTFGLIPKSSLPDEEKITYTDKFNMASITHEPRQLDCKGTVKFSVFGACVNLDEIKQASLLYADNKEARQYVFDAMVIMWQMSKDFRTDKKIPNKGGKFCKFSSVLNKLTKKEHTSHSTINTYTTICEGKYALSPEQGDAGGERVSAIYVTMKIETVTIAPSIYNEPVEDVGMRHMNAKATPETIMTQSVSYSATYHGTRIIERGYDLRMVTVNTGCGKDKKGDNIPSWKEQMTPSSSSPWYHHVGMIVFDIGNGIPVQYVIKSHEDNPNNTAFTHAQSSDSAASTEVIFSALIRGLRKAVATDQESLANGFVATVSDAISRKVIKIGIEKNQPKILNEQKKNQFMNVRDVRCGPLQGAITCGTLDSYFMHWLFNRSEATTIFASVGVNVTIAAGKVWVPPLHTRLANNAHLKTARAWSVVGSEFDIEEIMDMASRPSAFDD